MTDQIISAVVAVLTLIAGVAILAVLVSRQSATSEVISAGFGGFSQALGVAVSPITGTGPGISSFRGMGGAGFGF